MKKPTKIEGTKQAFLTMISIRGVYKKLDVDRSAVSNWKRALCGADIKYKPTIETMEIMLQRYGATIVHEKVWSIKLPE